LRESFRFLSVISRSLKNQYPASRIRTIDGLRGIAVVLVILYHANIPAFPLPGGFLGVDIFYVISGYVVCKSLQERIDQNILFLSEFYARRVVRLFPALVITLLLTSIASLFLLYPFDLQAYLRSMIGVNFLGANFWFWRKTTNYFDPTSSYSPLIHTWSLAVEEQFYLLFPAVLLLINKLRKHFQLLALIGITLMFLLLTASLSVKFPNATFYLLPFRVWEFGFGIIVYFLHRKPVGKIYLRGLSINLLQVAYLITVLVICLNFNPLGNGMILTQVIVTLLTGLLLLFCRRDSRNKEVLSHPLFVGIGVISYGAYLLHQPIFTFLLYAQKTIPTTLQLIAAIILTFIFAWLIHHLFEKPIQLRYSSHPRPRRVLASWIFVSILITSTSLILISTKATAHRVTPVQAKILAFAQTDNGSRFEWKKCFLSGNDLPKLFASYCQGNQENSPLLMFGDSHSAMISSALAKKVPGMARFSSAGCAPILETAGVTHECHQVNKFIFNRISELHPKVILIKNNWLDDAVNGTFRESFIRNMESTLQAIKVASPQSQIFILGNTPQWLPSLPVALVRANVELVGMQWIYTPKLSLLEKSDSQLLQISKSLKIHFISYLPKLCHSNSCLAVATVDGVSEPFAFDYGHTTRTGSNILADATLTEISAYLR
jgi:peptidoglycan/LPS O-acetylase OafA/YrhL